MYWACKGLISYQEMKWIEAEISVIMMVNISSYVRSSGYHYNAYIACNWVQFGQTLTWRRTTLDPTQPNRLRWLSSRCSKCFCINVPHLTTSWTCGITPCGVVIYFQCTRRGVVTRHQSNLRFVCVTPGPHWHWFAFKDHIVIMAATCFICGVTTPQYVVQSTKLWTAGTLNGYGHVIIIPRCIGLVDLIKRSCLIQIAES